MRTTRVSVTLGLLALVLGLVLLREFVAWPARSTAPPRNLLLVTLDTLRADRLPAYGFQGYSTPTLDRLAGTGLVIQEALAAAPLTLPSHASILTGRYPPRLGMTDNAGPPLGDDVTTIAESLGARGMKTAAFLASGVMGKGRGLEQGFEVYDTGDRTECANAPPRRRAEAVVDQALDWLREHDAQPFFQWVHFYDTHRPYDLPVGYQAAHFDPYLAAILYVDAQLGRLVQYLDERRLLDRTLIVIAGDHAESLGDHGEESHGIFLYHAALQVPLILHGPGVPARRSHGPASLVDIAATVLPRFGVSGEGLDGIDVLASGTSRGRLERDIYAESMYPVRFGWSAQRALYDGRYKLIHGPRPELYDLRDDPFETRDLAAERISTVQAMARRLESYGGEDRTSESVGPSPELRERLASLGYVSGSPSLSSAAAGDPATRDPRDYITTYNEITTAQWHRAATRREACR
jgi:arylsulfatase A-like enzyme